MVRCLPAVRRRGPGRSRLLRGRRPRDGRHARTARGAPMRARWRFRGGPAPDRGSAAPARPTGGPAACRPAVADVWYRSRAAARAPCARAGVAQLAERQPSKLHVAGSIPVSRSTSLPCWGDMLTACSALCSPDWVRRKRVPHRFKGGTALSVAGLLQYARCTRRIGVPGGLRELRDRERGGAQVLQGMRRPTRAALPVLRSGQQRRREVLRRVRGPARRRSNAVAHDDTALRSTCTRPRLRHRTAARLGALRRPRRLHAFRRGARRGGGPRRPVPVLRAGRRGDRPPRRDGREVHRRRGHGRLGGAGRPRGRRRAGGAGRPRARRCRPLLRAHDAGPRRGPDRRGRRDHGRRRPGDGRRRPCQLRLAPPVGCPARGGVGRGSHAAGRRRRDRLRAGRRADPQGEGRARARLACAAGRRGTGRPQPGGGARGAVRRASRRAAPPQGPLPRDGPRAAAAPRFDHRPGRHRQDAARLGVPQVRRRARRRCLLARRTLPRLRRRDHLLGARRDGPRAGRPPRDRRRADDTSRDRRDRRRARARPRGAALDRAGTSRPPRDRDERRRSGAALRVPGGRTSSGSPPSPRWSWSSRTSSTPTRACSTSSTTCSSGAGAVPIYVLTLARPELWSGARTGGRAGATSRASTWSRCRSPPCASSSAASSPVSPSPSSRAIVERADGVPLYAVETVRMLLDDGALVASDGDLPSRPGTWRRSPCPRRSRSSSPPVWTPWSRPTGFSSSTPPFSARASRLRPWRR